MDISDIKKGFSKYACYNRAKSLLSTGDDLQLRYVCLELRFCLEALTYDKLKLYKSRLPPSLLSTWQPPQALKVLERLEPGSTEDFTLYFGREDTPGQPASEVTYIGTHKFIDLRWLRKTYNKLGNYLHVPTPSAKRQQPLRSDLEKMLQTLEPIVQSSLDATIAETVEFDCHKCEKKVLTNKKGLKTGSEVECLDENCGTIYWVHEQDDGKFKFILKAARFSCKECSDTIEIGYRFLTVGYQFRCTNCDRGYQLAGVTYREIDPQ